jgi:alginate O-acetyltransferase complex protein AlgI
MLFHSLEFLVFFMIVYGLYIVLEHRWQNRLLLFASFTFYGWWDWRFLVLFTVSLFIDYNCCNQIAKTSLLSRRRLWLALSMCTNLGILGFFKYYNFFADSAERALASVGITADWTITGLVLPVGISF